MKRTPFKMLPSRGAVLRCDGKFIVGGRASFAWETFLLRRAAGVPGVHEIRLSGNDKPWHRIERTIEEAEAELLASSMFGKRRVERARATRAGRQRRGLPVG